MPMLATVGLSADAFVFVVCISPSLDFFCLIGFVRKRLFMIFFIAVEVYDSLFIYRQFWCNNFILNHKMILRKNCILLSRRKSNAHSDSSNPQFSAIVSSPRKKINPFKTDSLLLFSEQSKKNSAKNNTPFTVNGQKFIQNENTRHNIRRQTKSREKTTERQGSVSSWILRERKRSQLRQEVLNQSRIYQNKSSIGYYSRSSSRIQSRADEHSKSFYLISDKNVGDLRSDLTENTAIHSKKKLFQIEKTKRNKRSASQQSIAAIQNQIIELGNASLMKLGLEAQKIQLDSLPKPEKRKIVIGSTFRQKRFSKQKFQNEQSGSCSPWKRTLERKETEFTDFLQFNQ